MGPPPLMRSGLAAAGAGFAATTAAADATARVVENPSKSDRRETDGRPPPVFEEGVKREDRGERAGGGWTQGDKVVAIMVSLTSEGERGGGGDWCLAGSLDGEFYILLLRQPTAISTLKRSRGLDGSSLTTDVICLLYNL